MGQDDVLAGQLRQQIDQYKQQIDAQTQTEEQRQQNAAFLADLEKTRQMESGMLSATTETQAMLLTTWKLEQDLAEVEARIQKEFPKAEVTETIREEQTQPVEMETKKSSGGIFSSLAKWVKKTFSADPKKVAAKQRAQRLKEKEAKYALEQAEKNRDVAEVMRVKETQGQPHLATPQNIIEGDLEFWKNTYLTQGWELSAKKPVNAKGELDDKVLLQQISAFLRELNTPQSVRDSKRTNAEGKEVFNLNVGEFSQEDLQFVLSHRTPEGIERIVKPFLDFDIAAAVEKYPLHTCKTIEEQRAMYEAMYFDMHKLQGMSQWFSKFAYGVATPEQHAQMEKKYEFFSLFYSWFNRLQNPYGEEVTAQQFHDKVLSDIPALERAYDAKCITAPKVIEAKNRQYKYPLTPEQRDELVKKYKIPYGSPLILKRELVEDPVGSGAWRDVADDFDVLKTSKTEYSSLIPPEEFEKLMSEDESAVMTLAEEVKQFSLVDKEGRPRLLGLEGLDELMAHGEEDLNYYEEQLMKAEILNIRMKNTPSYREKHAEEATQIDEIKKQIFTIRSALASKMRNPVSQEYSIRGAYANGYEDPFWAERMQNAQMDAYDKTH